MARRRRIVSALIFLAAGVTIPLLLPLDQLPRNGGFNSYRANALEMRSFLNDNPVGAAIVRLTTIRTGFSAPSFTEGGCTDPADNNLPSLRDVRVTMTDYSLFAIPLRRYGVDCGGVYIMRLPPLGGFRDR